MATSTSANVATTPSPRDIDSACTDARQLAFESLQPVWESYVTRVSDALTVATHRHDHGHEVSPAHVLSAPEIASQAQSPTTSPTASPTTRSRTHTKTTTASGECGNNPSSKTEAALIRDDLKSSILDVASGLGEPACTISAALGHLGVRVVSSDVEPKFAALAEARARSKGLHSLATATLDGCYLSGVDDGEFDAVTCCFGLMYTDHRQALRAAARVLRPFGTVVATVWHSNSFAQVTDRVLLHLLAEPPSPEQPRLAKMRRAYILMKTINWHTSPTAVPTRLRDPSLVDEALAECGLIPARGHNDVEELHINLGPFDSAHAWRAGLVLVLDSLQALIDSGEVTETEIRDAFATACMELGHVDEGRCVLRGNTFRWVIATKAAYPTE